MRTSLVTRLRVGRALSTSRDEVVTTFEDVPEESFGCVQLLAQPPYLPHPSIDHGNALRLVAMKNLADLRQAQPHSLTGLDDTQTLKVLLRVVAVSRRGPLRNDDPLVFPMSQHMSRNTELCRCLTDSHAPMIAH